MSGDAQYEQDTNLATRIAFHENYTEPPQDFSRWVFDHIPFAAGQKVLELGCGNGEFWVRNADQLPEGLTLVLTDTSPGMVGAAKKRLSDAGISATHQVMSAEEPSIDEQDVDLILAKHMLYHVSDRPKALSAAKNLLSPGGTFCATTNSGAYLEELQALLTGEGVPWYSNFTDEFTLENGAEQLSAHFSSVRLDTLDGQLVVPVADAIVDYVRSTASLFPDPDLVLAASAAIRPKVQEAIDREGAFRIGKRAGIFLCQ